MPGAPNGVSRSRSFDRWFRYPAGFSPATLDAAFDASGVEPGACCVDPFAGSASAGTHSLDKGISYVGIEAHPLIAELGDLKFRRPGDPEELTELAAVIAAEHVPGDVAREADLVRRCFSDEVLTELVGLRRAVEERAAHPWSQHLKWALLGTLRDVATAKVGWPYQRPALSRAATFTDPVRRFRDRAQMMATDLAAAREPYECRVVAGDSRQPETWERVLSGETAAGSVSSPPYLNNFDYADATRLELYFLKTATTWSEMCERVRSPMLVATTQQTRIAISESSDAALATHPKTSTAVRSLVERLAVEREVRAHGKEYDRVLSPYFHGLARVLACLYDRLEPGAMSAWIVGDSAPYGIYIDTPALILDLAVELGYERVEDTLLRVRGQRWRTNGTRHQVELTERMIVFRRPPLSANPR